MVTSVYAKDKQILERVQHRFTRMLPKLKKLDYSDRLEELKLWTLEERRNRADLIEVFKIYRGISKIPFESIFEARAQIATRGHNLRIAKHRCNKDLRNHFFSEKVINRWNKLTSCCIEVLTVNAFKNNLQRLKKVKMGFFMD